MARHMRRQITDAVRTALLGLPTAGANVFKARTWPLDDKTPVALLIWTRGGDSGFDAMDPDDATRPLERNERLVVEAVVRHGGVEPAAASIEDLLDDMCAEVEPRLMSDAPLKALLEVCELVQTQKDSALQGDTRRGSCRLTYKIVYRTPAGDPTTRI